MNNLRPVGRRLTTRQRRNVYQFDSTVEVTIPEEEKLKMRSQHYRSASDKWPHEGVSGVIMNVDGVLQRGGKVLPVVQQAVRSLSNNHIPTLYYSDGYPEWTESGFAQNLSQALGTHVTNEEVVLSGDSLSRYLAGEYREKTVLVIGPRGTVTSMRQKGFSKAVSVEGLVKSRPLQTTRAQSALPSETGSEKPYQIDAVFIMGEPVDWGSSLQVCMDVLQSKAGLITGESGVLRGLHDALQPVPVFSFDARKFTATAYDVPRLGCAAFTEALSVIYRSSNANRALNVTNYNRLSPSSQAYLAARIASVSSSMGHTLPMSHIYNITDNPENDGVGVSLARERDHRWWNIVVATGVCRDGNAITGSHSYYDLIKTQDEAVLSYPDRKSLCYHLDARRADAAYLSLPMFVCDLLGMEYAPSSDELLAKR
eukprot:TRINITY_DN1147_c3_g1_i1.p1 TRINITY_DN1147_c3_g1~~TRINITY_DN1147_c3_g1_i1.p1  ORF type:complete len:435 (+),score=60.36 TRINITY_DN1147_c3_g1_i1:28-1305(+)